MSDSDIAIRIEGIGKKYKLGETFDTARNFRETLMSLPRHFSRKLRNVTRADHRFSRGEHESTHTAPKHVVGPREENGWFWALKDINLEIKRGEAIGIIGRNGAGKSTLLKILSRITAPTEGYAEIRGRVGALLEVGTGMHPELTGRENIYLNGAIIGMTKAEIDAKFDQIVDFAGTESFLDTPLKRYSSGMRVRLGFSVAAHLEPEVLIVDEVLSVGDAEFRKKCLGKMDEVTWGGRTVLFVSHNMQAMQSLCERGVLLESGGIVIDTTAEEAVRTYLAKTGRNATNTEIPAGAHMKPNPGLCVQQLEMLDETGKQISSLVSGRPFRVRLHYRINAADSAYRVGLVVKTVDNTRLAVTINTQTGQGHFSGEAGRDYHIDVACQNPLMPGQYLLDVNTKNSAGDYVDSIQGISVDVLPGKSGASGTGAGLVDLGARWSEPEIVR